MAVTPLGGHIGVLLAIAVAGGVSFAAASMLLGFGRAEQPVVESSSQEAVTAPTGA
jgi:mannitol-specific phosphotransferase system IIBC component